MRSRPWHLPESSPRMGRKGLSGATARCTKNASSDWPSSSPGSSEHITGDEKGEAQIFLDRLFQAFGRKGRQGGRGDAAKCASRRPTTGGTAFADLVWKPVVLIEMKRRGEDLTRHYRQAFDYWTRLVPGRPRYVVLCNFDEFWVYDFETQMDAPVDQLAAGRPAAAATGRWPSSFPPTRSPSSATTTRPSRAQAADRLADVLQQADRPQASTATLAQRFILQMLVALFAEDIGLLEQYLVTRLLDDCKEPARQLRPAGRAVRRR